MALTCDKIGCGQLAAWRVYVDPVQDANACEECAKKEDVVKQYKLEKNNNGTIDPLQTR